jgi:hypothetical protein
MGTPTLFAVVTLHDVLGEKNYEGRITNEVTAVSLCGVWWGNGRFTDCE